MPNPRIPIDKDTVVVLLKIARKSPTPLTPEAIHKALPVSYKQNLSTIKHLLSDMTRKGQIFKWTSNRRKIRYWHMDPSKYGKDQLLDLLSESPMTRDEMDKKLALRMFKCSKSTAETIRKAGLAQFLTEGKVYPHPCVGRQRKVRFSTHPPDPAPYLNKVEKELREVMAKLKPAGVSPDRVFHVLDTELRSRFCTASKPLPNDREPLPTKPVPEPGPDFEQIIVDAIFRVEPRARQMAVVSIPELRAAVDLEKNAFDKAVMKMAMNRKIHLHRHAHPAQLTAKELESLVTDGQGNYYVGIVLRQ